MIGKRGYKDAHPAMTQNRDQAPILMYQNSSTRQLHIEIFWCYMQACCHILKNFKIGQASLSLLRAFLILDTTDTETKDFVLGLVKLKILQNYFYSSESFTVSGHDQHSDERSQAEISLEDSRLPTPICPVWLVLSINIISWAKLV